MNPNTHPLAQDFAIALQVPDPASSFFHDPNMARLDDGTIIIAAPQWSRDRDELDFLLRIARSRDGGQTWEELPGLPYQEGIPFVLDTQLFMFVQEVSHRDVQIVASNDDGITWTDPVTVIEGPLWNISTARLVRPDAMLWAMDYDLPERMYSGKVMVRLDRANSILDPQAWSTSNVVEPPELPDLLTRGLYQHGNTPDLTTSWSNKFVLLEPNTVDVNGHIRVFTRAIIDEYATAHMAAVYDYDEESRRTVLHSAGRVAWRSMQILHCSGSRSAPSTGCSATWLLILKTCSGWGRRMRETGYSGGPGQRTPLALPPLQHRLPKLVSGRLRGTLARRSESAASCTRVPSSMATTWSFCRAAVATPATSTTPTCARSIG